MKISGKIITAILVLIASVFFLQGCGGQDEDTAGCPSGSALANSSDTLTMPDDTQITAQSSFGFPRSALPYDFVPLIVTVKDKAGNPRNNVCVRFYSDGIWYTDHTHSTLATVDASNSVVAVTNDHGVITLYWSTEVLPAANPVTVDSSTTPPTYTAGKDITGESFIQAYSGALTDLFTVSWTVQGEPGPN